MSAGSNRFFTPGTAIRAALFSATALAVVLGVGRARAGCGSESIDTAETQTGNKTYCAGLNVGDEGIGSLVISSGGTVTNTEGRIGNDSGSDGTVTVTGSTWTNTGTLSVGYSGTGRLTISDGGTVSSSWGYIGHDNGATGTVTVTGAGSSWTGITQLHVGQNGTGTLIVSSGGAVTVGGGTGVVILAQNAGSTGTLNIGSAAGEEATGAGTVNAGTVTGSGTVVFNHTDTNYVFAPNIDAGGSVKAYSGTTTLTGAVVYSGATTVYGGRLLINGSMASSASTVKTGGILGGTGRLATVTVESGGILAPGNTASGKIANLRTKDLTLNSGGILEIEVSDPEMTIRRASYSADRVTVSGAVDLSGGTLRVIGLTGEFDDDQYVHEIIDNDGTDAVVGTFGAIDNRLAFYEAAVDYAADDGNDVVLTLDRNENAFVDVAATANEKAVAGRLNGLPGSDGDAIRTSLLGLTTEATRNAYKQLSGDIYATNQVLNVQTSQQARQQVVARLGVVRAANAGTAQQGFTQTAGQVAGFAPADRAAEAAAASLGFSRVWENLKPAAGGGLWVQGVGGRGRVDGDGNAVTVDYDWRGMMSGYDAALSPEARLGVFFGYVDGENVQTEVSTRIDSETLMAGIYGSYDRGDWHLSGQAGWSRIASDSSRELTFGSVDRTVLSGYTDHMVSLDGEIARDIEIGTGLWVEPYVALAGQCEFLDGFTEAGGGAANLTRASDRVITGNSTVGGRVSGLWDSGKGWRIAPQAGIGWRHHLGPTDNSVTFNYQGGTPFSVSGTETDHDTLIANVGISRLSDDGWAAYADYRPSVSKNRREHAVVAGLRVEW